MSKRVICRDEKVNHPMVGATFEISLEVPDGFSFKPRTALDLAYPIELGVLANWDLPPTESVEPQLPATWPRIDLMGPDGAVLWVLRGDVALDYSVVPQMGDWFLAKRYRYVAPPAVFEEVPEGASTAGIQAAPAPFSNADEMGSFWKGVRVWGRLIPLTGKAGGIGARPPYLVAYGFAGSGNPPVEALNQAVTSIEPNYFS
jgi:hypothetical protein